MRCPNRNPMPKPNRLPTSCYAIVNGNLTNPTYNPKGPPNQLRAGIDIELRKRYAVVKASALVVDSD